MPVALAPTGLTGMQHADGEILAAQAAEKFGMPFTLSTMSICSIEDVAEATKKPFWFQLYVMRDRDFVESLIDRAKAASCSALVLTLDLQILGQRHKDIAQRPHRAAEFTPKLIWQMATQPALVPRHARHQAAHLPQHRRPCQERRRPSSLSAWTDEQFDPRLNWKDVAWIKERWGGKLILKGILDPEDAQRRPTPAPTRIIVSNHGGRQLDGAPSSIACCPRSSTRSATRSRCISTAASAPARTC